MTSILILKTGALGDVLRTTSILPGLHRRYGRSRVVWLTAPAAVELVAQHPLIAEIVAVDPGDEAALDGAARRLSVEPWQRVLSFDEEEPLCRLASRLGRPEQPGVLSGAFLRADGARAYTPDTAAWFDMGLVSVHGKSAADRLKRENTESHPAIFARMLGIEMGAPELPLPERSRRFAARFAARLGLHAAGPVIGLNTGAGGRWQSKRLSVECTSELAVQVSRQLGGAVSFLVLGGPEEAERNRQIAETIGARARCFLAGTDHGLLDFAALVDRLDLLVSSDSLALHVGVARRVPVVAFFAPTSAAEIELYGRGEKVLSTAPDYCSYRADADASTLTAERLAAAVLRTLRRSEADQVRGAARISW